MKERRVGARVDDRADAEAAERRAQRWRLALQEEELAADARPAVAPCKVTRLEREIEFAERAPLMQPGEALAYASWMLSRERGWHSEIEQAPSERAPLPPPAPAPGLAASRRSPAPPSMIRVEPAIAYGALAVHALADGVHRSLTATAPPAARLAARGDGPGPVALDDYPDTLSAITAASAEAGEPLPEALRARFEAELGRPLGHVRLHTSAAASTAARAIHARAFTLGSHIYFASGELAPGSDRGDRLLRHELTHVLQHDEGRLRSQSGGLEVEAHDSAAEVEARAAEERAPQPPATPAHATPAPATPAAPAMAPAPAPAAAGASVPGVIGRSALGDLASGAAEWAGDQLLGVVERVSPALANLIKNGPSATVFDEVKKVLFEVMSKAVPGNALSGLSELGGGLGDLGGILIGAASGDAKCCETFAGWCKSLGTFARKAASSGFVKKIKGSFAALDAAVAWVIRLFGGGMVESLRGHLQFLTAMGGWMGDALSAVAKVTQKALDWALKKLGLPDVAALGAWLQKLAEKAWAKIQGLVVDGVAALKKFAPVLLSLSGLAPLVEAFRSAMEIIEVVDWLVAHRNDPNLVRNAREQMAHTFLPKLIDGTAALRGKLAAAYTWIKDALGKVRDVLAEISPYLVGMLAPLAPLILPVAAFVRALWPKVVPVVESLWKDLTKLAERVWHYAKPVIEVLLMLIRLAANPWSLPLVVVSGAWLLLPECLKPPILDLILDLMIAALEVLPDSMVLFGPMWRFMKSGTIGFLKKVQTSWSPAQQVVAIDHMARMASGASFDMMAGFVVGFFKGLVAGVLDPFKMIYELLKIGWQLSTFFAKLVNHAPQLAKVIGKHLPKLEEQAEKLATSGKQALDDFLAGKIGFDQVWALVTSFVDQIDAAAASLGATVADKIKAFFTGASTEYELAEAIGIAIGFLIMFALIVYFSGSAYAQAKGVIGVVAQIARILNLPYELLGAALKPLTKMFGPVLEALSSLGARLGLKAAWEGGLRAFEMFVQLVGRLAEDILLAIEGRFVERTLQELIEIMGRRLGAQLAEKLLTELGEKGAQQVVDKLGEDVVKRLGDLSADVLLQLSVKLDKAIVGRMLDNGWTPAMIGRFGLALERPVLEGLLSAGLGGAQLERLAALSAEKLQGQSAATLSRLAQLPEAQLTRLGALGDAGFRRLIALPEGQLARFTALGDEQLRFFSELSEGAFARFSALTDPQFARFSSMSALELQRFAGLSEGALQRFAAVSDELFLKFRGMAPEALERFGGLTEPAFARFAALDAANLAKFEGVLAPALERYGTMPANFQRFAALDKTLIEKFGGLGDDAFARFAGVSDNVFLKFRDVSLPALERFGALSQTAFDRFAALNKPTLAMLEKLGALEVQGLEHLAAVGDPQAFNILARQIGGDELGHLTVLTGPELERLMLRLDCSIPVVKAIGALEGAQLKALVAIADDALFHRFVALPTAELKGFAGLTTAELEQFAVVLPEDLGKFGALGDLTVLQHYLALPPAQLTKFGKTSAAALATWGRVQPSTFAHFAGYEAATLDHFGQAGVAALEKLTPKLTPRLFEELRFVSGPGIARFAELPAAQLAKFEGLSGAGLQKLADLPAGQLEHLAANESTAVIAAAAGEDAAGLAASQQAAAALDSRAGSQGHAHSAHGAATNVVDPLTGMTPTERRLRTGRRPDGATDPALRPKVGSFASDAAQAKAAELGDAQLRQEIAQGGGVGKVHSDVDVVISAGYQYRIVGGQLVNGQLVGGTMVREQCDVVRIGYHAVNVPPTSVADYMIVTMFPYVPPL